MNTTIKWAIGLGLIGIAGAAGLSALVARIDLGQQLSSAAAEHGYQLSINGGIGFTLWPVPSLTVDAINFADRIDPSLATVKATVDQLRVAADWQQLLSGQLAVDTVVVTGADITVADFAALAALANSDNSAAPSTQTDSTSRVQVNQITLQESTITGPIGGRANTIDVAGELQLAARSGELQAVAAEQPVLNGNLIVLMDWQNSPSASITLRSGGLNIGLLGGGQPLWLEQLAAQINATGSALVLHTLTGRLAEGELIANGQVSLAANNIQLTGRSQLTGVKLEPLLASQDSDLPLAGTVNFDGLWSGALPLAGDNADPNAPLKAIQGQGRLNSDALRFTATNLERDFCSAATLIDGGSLSAQRATSAGLPEQTEFQAFSADWQLADGSVELNNIVGGVELLSLAGNGRVDLLADSYRLRLNATMAGAASSAAGCDINPKLLGRALPFNCSGSYSEEPSNSCSLDRSAVEALLKGKLLETLQRKLQDQGGQGLAPLLDKLFK